MAMGATHDVAEIFGTTSPANQAAYAAHLNLHQLRVMSAIGHCRTVVRGANVEACTDCGLLAGRL